MRSLLAFDLGASSGRLIRGSFDGERLALEELHRFANDPVLVGGHMYWDILRLYHEIKQGLVKACRAGGGDSLGIDTWGLDYGLLDRNGQLLGNPHHYRDERTLAAMPRFFRERMDQRTLYGRTGIAMLNINTLIQLYAETLADPGALERAQTLLFIPDLLCYFLTGEKSTEYTIASTSQMLGADTHTWDEAVLQSAGVPRRLLTDLCQPGVLRGALQSAVREELGLPALPVVAVAEHDTASAVAAVPAMDEPYAYISSGTWSLMGTETKRSFLTDEALRYNYTHEGGLEGNLRFLKNIMGLWIVQELRREWTRGGGSLSFAQMVDLAREAPAFACFINPDDQRFAGPNNMSAKIQAFCGETGQRVPQTKGEIIRCVYESLAMRYRWALDGMERATGQTFACLHIIGGGSQNDLLNAMTASAIGRTVLAGPAEATAVGNLLVQAMALGDIANQAELRQVVARSFPTRAFMPEAPGDWDAAYADYLRIQA